MFEINNLDWELIGASLGVQFELNFAQFGKLNPYKGHEHGLTTLEGHNLISLPQKNEII